MQIKKKEGSPEFTPVKNAEYSLTKQKLSLKG